MLTSLPNLPPMLFDLDCKDNQISSLPNLPNRVHTIDCRNNQLTSLPTLPSLMEELHCSFNQITTLPNIPPTFSYQLECDHNQLTSLPEFPDSISYLNISNNPISCLPQIKKIGSFFWNNTNINCLPNYGTINNATPSISSLPLCDLLNPNGCNTFSNIAGKNYFDYNANCLLDSTDVRQGNMHIMLYENGTLIQQTFTGGEGYYSFNVNDSAGNYEVLLDTSNIPFNVLCPVSNAYNDTITATDSLFYNNDFALTCKSGFDLGVWSIEGYPFRPGHTTDLNISAGDIANFYGVHCANGISGTVTCVINGPVSYVSPAAGALTPSMISGDTITYNISDFGTVNLFTAFNMIVRTDTTAISGSQVCVTVSVTPTIGDNNPTNNTLTHCFTVHASYDPNEKEVDPISDIDIAGNKWLTYTIHFQNTGTATAEHIYVIDTLDHNLDLSTFQLLAYSHQPLVQILDGGIARFNFPNINLADSNSNEPASHGYVQYKIKMKNTLNGGMQIHNTGHIYFDFNSPVATNTVVSNVTNVLGLNPVFKTENTIKIFPNPTTGEFNLSFTNHIGEKASLKIYNLLGETIFEKQFTVSSSLKINRSEITMQKGMYVVEIVFGNYSEKKKLIVE